jgi:hypothetical protein
MVALLRKGVKKQQHLSTTFKKLLKSVDKSCIILLSVEPVKPRVGLLNRSYLFGTALSFFNFEGGNGIGFFEPQGMLVNSLPKPTISIRSRANCAADFPARFAFPTS